MSEIDAALKEVLGGRDVEDVIDETLSEAGGRGRKGGPKAAGPGGTCVCPKCGHKVPHDTAEPCMDMQCPNCGAGMIREEDEDLDEAQKRDILVYDDGSHCNAFGEDAKALNKAVDVMQTTRLVRNKYGVLACGFPTHNFGDVKKELAGKGIKLLRTSDRGASSYGKTGKRPNLKGIRVTEDEDVDEAVKTAGLPAWAMDAEKALRAIDRGQIGADLALKKLVSALKKDPKALDVDTKKGIREIQGAFEQIVTWTDSLDASLGRYVQKMQDIFKS